MSGFRGSAFVCVMATVGALAAEIGLTAQGPVPDFTPDVVVSGSDLTGWETLGEAEWRAENGVLVGSARPDGPGGWLVFERSFQDVNVLSRFRCAGPCKTGVMLRTEQTPDGLKRIFVSLAEGDLEAYRVTLDADGREVEREALRPLPPGMTGRVAPAAVPEPPASARVGGEPAGTSRGRGRGGPGAGRGRG